MAVGIGTFAFIVRAQADIVSVSEMVHGIKKTRAQCAVTQQAAWVTAMGRKFCMRYYMAPSHDTGRKPIVFLQGDRLGVLNLRTGAFAVPESEKDINTDDLMKVAVSLSKQTKTTAIYLGRVGLEGSSGDHRLRHSMLELAATNAALDALKTRFKFSGFHLIGQSGGAHLVAGLLALRDDVGCAVIGSGPLAPTRRSSYWENPALEHFNPANNVDSIVQHAGARIIVITDLADKKVSAEKQTGFVRTLQQAGRPIEQYLVQAVDENRHGVVAYSRVALSGCLKGAGRDQIAQQIEKLVRYRLAASKQKDERRNGAEKTRSTPANEAQGLPNAGETVRPRNGAER